VGGVLGVAVATSTGAVVGAAGAAGVAGLPQAALNMSSAISAIINADFDVCDMLFSPFV
jgi:hypothetical protein